MNALHLLHLSDLHTGSPRDELWPTARSALLEDLENLSRHLSEKGHGPWDAVVFTGDLAFRGAADDYKKLDERLSSIWTSICKPWPDGPTPVLLALPGNHDLIRPPKKDKHVARARKQPDDIWRDPTLLAEVASWFKHYEAWWENCTLRPPDLRKGKLPGDWAWVLDRNGVRVGFLSINATFLHTDDAVDGKLSLDLRQIVEPVDNDLDGWVRGCDAAFLLTHQPVSWLSPEARRRYDADLAPPGRFAAHLCGHMHASATKSVAEGFGPERVFWQACSLFGLERVGRKEERRFGYTAIRLELTSDGVRAIHWPRLGTRKQDGAWGLTADPSFRLLDDFGRTNQKALVNKRRHVVAPEMSSPPTPIDWETAVLRSPVWQRVKDHPRNLEEARARASKLIAECQMVWNHADEAVPGDPWRDHQAPVRMLRRIVDFLGAAELTAADGLLLTVVPFARQAIRAAAVCWMAKADVCDVQHRGDAREPRNILERIHLANPAFVERAAAATPEACRAIATWLMHRAIDVTTGVWNEPHLPAIADLLTAWSRWFDDAEKLRGLARAAPSDHSPLGVLVRLAEATSLDLLEADEVAVDHVGVDDAYDPLMLRAAVTNATWRRDEGTLVLTALCAHPVIDFVLKDLIERADDVLSRASLPDDGPRFALPKRISAAGVEPQDHGGRPAYRLPHIRFRLDHTRVRELLMGDQLYGDARVALRELYQNALDACRFRRARDEYRRRTGDPSAGDFEGQIEFVQGTDERDRPYIECRDNGAGMTEDDLEHVFAIAGRRFRDRGDFLDEHAKWRRCEPPIEIHPNSQFGVGVFSYFMMADEIEVVTRRVDTKGTIGPCLNVRISSGSGLFRLSRVEGDDRVEGGGTCVRLYLARRHRTVSCRAMLEGLIWVAEFATTVTDDEGEPSTWTPGELRPARPSDLVMTKPGQGRTGSFDDAELAKYLRAGPNLWWTTGRGLVLADGLLTRNEGIPNVVVNLTGPRVPKMTMDRREVTAWDRDWVAPELLKSAPVLASWEALTWEMLWSIDDAHPRVSMAIESLLDKRDAPLPFAKRLVSPRAVRDLGVFAIDARSTHRVPGSNLLLDERYRAISHPGEIPRVVPRAGDAALLDELRGNASTGRVRLADVVLVAGTHGRSVEECAARVRAYRSYGVRLVPDGVDAPALSPEDRRLISEWLNGRPPRMGYRRNYVFHVTQAAKAFSRPFAEVWRRFTDIARPLGMQPPSLVDGTTLAILAGTVGVDDLASFTRDAFGLPISTIDTRRLVRACLKPSVAARRRVADRLCRVRDAFGLELGFDPHRLETIAWTPTMSRILRHAHGFALVTQSPFVVYSVAGAADLSAKTVVEARDVVAASVGIAAAPIPSDVLDGLSQDDARLLSHLAGEPTAPREIRYVTLWTVLTTPHYGIFGGQSHRLVPLLHEIGMAYDARLERLNGAWPLAYHVYGVEGVGPRLAIVTAALRRGAGKKGLQELADFDLVPPEFVEVALSLKADWRIVEPIQTAIGKLLNDLSDDEPIEPETIGFMTGDPNFPRIAEKLEQMGPMIDCFRAIAAEDRADAI